MSCTHSYLDELRFPAHADPILALFVIPQETVYPVSALLVVLLAVVPGYLDALSIPQMRVGLASSYLVPMNDLSAREEHSG